MLSGSPLIREIRFAERKFAEGRFAEKPIHRKMVRRKTIHRIPDGPKPLCSNNFKKK